jgi:catechol 2,3-dioxygenase-like lactoylglutathione lyase family enzyme
MIGYTCVGTNDLDKAVAFYSDLLGVLGAKVFFKSDRGVGSVSYTHLTLPTK